LKIIKKEAQFIIPSFLCFLLFIIIKFKRFFLVSDLSYWSSYLTNQPYRILSYSFVHKDFNHLLSNIFGIIVVRYCFINLNLKNIFLFLYLIILLIPIQTFFLFVVDNFLFYNPNHLLVGFSGIIFGTFSFILLSSLYGKEYILNIFIGLKKNNEIYKLMTVFLSLGIVYSLLPSISLSGHIAGILSGFIIFILLSNKMLTPLS
jgi:membrane associated rhomboid family serine protease